MGVGVGGGGGVVSKKFFQPSWPLFGLKSREVGLSGPSSGCATVYAGLLIFRAVAEPRNSGTPQNPAKFTKTRKILRNLVKTERTYLIKYNVFQTYFSHWGYLLAVNFQIYLKTSSLKRANNVMKLPGIDYVAKNWALAMMLKALPLVHFLNVLSLKEQMITSVRKTLKTLV